MLQQLNSKKEQSKGIFAHECQFCLSLISDIQFSSNLSQLCLQNTPQIQSCLLTFKLPSQKTSLFQASNLIFLIYIVFYQYAKTAITKYNRDLFLHSPRDCPRVLETEVQEQDAGRFGFSGDLSPWLQTANLLPPLYTWSFTCAYASLVSSVCVQIFHLVTPVRLD